MHDFMYFIWSRPVVCEIAHWLHYSPLRGLWYVNWAYGTWLC